jgi:predicted nucleic acid-binding protein
METMDGIFRSADPVGARADFEAWLTGGVPVLPFDLALALRTARLRVDLAAQGRRTRSRALDPVVAATALEHGLTLVTRNKADYQDIPNLILY